MEFVRLGNSGLEVSRVCLGAMNFGTDEWGCDCDQAAEIVATYRDAGGNFFDTADVYGGGASEEILGELLRGSRDEVVIATKVGMSTKPGPNAAGLSAKRIRTAVVQSLRRLRTDYIDLYQVHHFDEDVPLAETLSTLDDLVREGLVRYVGCSNYFAWQIAEAVGLAARNGHTPFISAQMMYSLIRRDIEREHVDCAIRCGVGIIGYGPLHSGLLAGGWTSRKQIPATSRVAAHPEVYLADEDRAFTITRALLDASATTGATPGQLALAWTLSNDAVACILTAAQDQPELSEQLAALDLDIPPDVRAYLDSVSALPVGYPADFYQRQDRRDHSRRDER